MAIATISEFSKPPLQVVLMYALRKRRGDSGGEAGADYLPSGSNEVKVWRRLSRFLLLDSCGWVVILGSACMEISWGWAHWETELDVQAAGAGT